MNMMKTTLFCALLMTTAGVWAQTETTTQQAQKPITPYGKNPNILHVWAYKTQEGVINTVEKVGTAVFFKIVVTLCLNIKLHLLRLLLVPYLG